MLAQGVTPFDPGLVSQSVNYHGHKLLQQIVSENAGQIKNIKLQDIDYKVYQSRQIELRNLGGSRVKEIIEFISSKSDQLLIPHPELTNVKNVEDTNYEDRYKHIIPFEFLIKADKNFRVDELLTHIEVGDILYTEVVNNFENTAYTLLKPIAYDKGKHRYLSDLRPSDFKTILRNEDTTVPKADEDKIGRWMVGTRLRVELLSIHLAGSVPTIYVGTKGVTLSPKAKEKFKLGKVLMKDLPKILSVSIDPSLKYVSDCIEKTDSYKNPQCIRQMADEMGVNLRWYPTLTSVRIDFAEKEKSESLRKAQMCKWAHKNVADGVAHFKQGQHEEAFQCLNKALQIDSENVEAFVAKGALLANLGRYEKAIEDFEKSLKLNPVHSNARKYMGETLVELGKQKEAKDLLKEAEKCYSRCLELNKDHEVAREALESVSEKLGPDSSLSLIKLIKQENLKQENDEFLANLLKIEETAKIKLEEEKHIPIIGQIKEEKLVEDNPIPIITSRYNNNDEAFLNEETQMSEPHSLSPLSQKLANEENLWSHPPPCTISSFMGPQGPSEMSEDRSLPMSVYSNPPPNWPMPDITKPPPMTHMRQQSLSEAALVFSEESVYNAKVDQFLKQLNSRGPSQKKRMSNSREEPRRRSIQKEVVKTPKRGRSSSSDSKSSRSSSSSSSNSSSSSSSSSSADSHKEKKKASKKSKKNKKKKKGKKKEKKTKKKMVPEIDVALPNIDDLEEKLNAHYKKIKELNSTPPEIESKTKLKSKSQSTKESKAKESQKESKTKEKSTPLVSKLKLFTHPAFLENDSDGDVVEEKKKKAEKHNKLLTKIKSNIADFESPVTIAERVRQAAKACEKAIKITSLSSPSSISSRSRSRSYSKGRSRRSRSRSYSRGRSRRSRSRSYSKGRPRRSRSRSRERRRRRSGSQSRNYRSRSPQISRRYPDKYRKYSRSRSRSKDRHPRHRSPISSHKPSMHKKPIRDSPFSYYGNKPLYKKTSLENKNGADVKTSNIPLPPLPKDDPKPPPPPVKFEIKKVDKPASMHIVEEAKRRIQLHILSNDRVRSSAPKFDTSQRFGKWESENKDASKGTPNSFIDIFGGVNDKDKKNFKPNVE